MRTRRWLGLFLLLALGLVAPKPSGAIVLPHNEDLFTTESKHFRLIVQESLKNRVPALIQDFEAAYTALNPMFNWVPREKVTALFFDALDTHNGWATVYPHPTILIYAADAQPGSTIYEPGDYLRRTTVTPKGRYRYPTIHPNRAMMAAIRVAAGLQNLMEVPLAQAGEITAERIYLQAEPDRTLVDPVYSPDGRYLLYVSANEQGSTLRQIERQSGTDQTVLKGEGIIVSPTFHPSGDYLVFSSDQNGVYNLYRLDFPAQPNAAAKPVTHGPRRLRRTHRGQRIRLKPPGMAAGLHL